MAKAKNLLALNDRSKVALMSAFDLVTSDDLFSSTGGCWVFIVYHITIGYRVKYVAVRPVFVVMSPCFCSCLS